MNLIEAFLYLRSNPGSFVYMKGVEFFKATLNEDRKMVWDDGSLISVQLGNLEGWEKEIKKGAKF